MRDLILFPDMSDMSVLDASEPWLPELNVVGKAAALRFREHVPDSSTPEPEDLRRGVQQFLRELAEQRLAVGSRSLVRDWMPRAWDRITADSELGRFADALVLLESVERVEREQTRQAGSRHAVLSYLDDLGREAADAALKKYRHTRGALALPGRPDDVDPTVLAESFKKAKNAFFETIAKELLVDGVTALKNKSNAAFWTLIGTAAAGLLGSLFIAPRAVLRGANDLGLSELDLKATLKVWRLNDDVKMKLGGSVVVRPGDIAEASSLLSMMKDGFGGSASIDFELGDRYEIGAKASYSPSDQEWKAMLTFKLGL